MTDVARGRAHVSITDLASSVGDVSAARTYVVHSASNADAPGRYWGAGLAFGFQSGTPASGIHRPKRTRRAALRRLEDVQRRISHTEEPGAVEELTSELAEFDAARRRATASALGDDE